MNVFLDDFLVGLVLLAGFGYAAYALGPRAVRTRLLTAMSWVLRRAPGVLGLGGIASRLASAATLKAKGSCGGCDSCPSTPGAAAPGDAAQAAGAPSVVSQGVGSQAAGAAGIGTSRAMHGAATPGPSRPAAAAVPEVRIPVSTIGKRRRY